MGVASRASKERTNSADASQKAANHRPGLCETDSSFPRGWMAEDPPTCPGLSDPHPDRGERPRSHPKRFGKDEARGGSALHRMWAAETGILSHRARRQ